MFWKNKIVPAKEEIPEQKSEERTQQFRRREQRIMHSKSIINGKLYDTEKSELLFHFGDHRALFRTKKGNFFSCKVCDSTSISSDAFIYETYYIDIKPEIFESAKEKIGKYNPDMYINIFGKPEDA